MSDLRYAVFLAFALAGVALAHLTSGCGGPSEPAQVPPVVFELCKGELVRLGADPARAEELCRTGGELLEQELAKLRERASVAVVPCGGAGAQ